MQLQSAPVEPGDSILIVDDEPVLRDRLARAFRDRGLEAHGARSFDEAMAVAARESPDLAVIDLKMPGPSGLEVLKALRALDPSIACVVVTGYGSIATALEAVQLGAVTYLQKPVDAEEILGAFAGTARGSTAADFDVPSLARVEWEHIQRVLGDCQGNVSEAARRLGLHRRSLQRKLNRHPPRR